MELRMGAMNRMSSGTVSKLLHSFVEFLDPENMEVAVGFFFLCIIGAEIRWGYF